LAQVVCGQTAAQAPFLKIAIAKQFFTHVAELQF